MKYGNERVTRGGSNRRVPLQKKEKKSPKDEAAQPKQKKKRTGIAKPVQLSEALGSFLGESELPRTEVVKRLHAYFKVSTSM